MSDILIKGMELPEEGVVELLLDSTGTVSGKIGTMYLVNTQAVEIPPHGRCIDADAVKELLYKKYLGRYRRNDDFNLTCDILDNAPAVLEASSKTDAPQKARICPHYQGVCGLDEEIVCYCSSSYEMCDKYREASNG